MHGSTNDYKLSQFLKRIRKRARRWILVEAISLIGLSIAAWFWSTLLLDWLIEPPPVVRLLAIGTLCLWVSTIVLNRLIRRLRAPLRDEQLALLVERTHPELQDSLSTAVELRLGETQSTLSTIDVSLLERTNVDCCCIYQANHDGTPLQTHSSSAESWAEWFFCWNNGCRARSPAGCS